MSELQVGSDLIDQLVWVISGFLDVQDVTLNHDDQKNDSIRFRGTLIVDLATEYPRLRETVERFGYTPWVRSEGEGVAIYAIPMITRPKPAPHWSLNLLLFILTIGSTLLVGASDTISQGNWWPGILTGWPFSLAILLILGAHELGHYFAARYHNVDVTLPYFIPVPTLIGTMGAFISVREPIPNRRILLDIGAAGPLAGLIFAIPFWVIGLAESTPASAATLEQGLSLGDSLLTWLTQILLFGHSAGVMLNQVAFAGWCGLLVTGLNLLPLGQLDGGHVAYVLFGKRANWLFWPAIIGLSMMSIVLNTNAWWIWIMMLFFIGRKHAQPLDDVTPLNPTRRIIAIICLIFFLLTFVPVPLHL